MNPPLLEIQDVILKFPGLEKPILDSVSYQVNPGDFIIILGSNGSGKSSFLKLIDRRYSLNALSSGKILLEGKLIQNYPAQKFSRKVKTLTQNCHESLFTSLTVLENYLLVKQQEKRNLFAIREKAERHYIGSYLAQFNLNLPGKLDQVVEQLSGGEKQALALALTMLYPPDILLLDEHTSALDPKSAAVIMALTKKTIAQYKITCLLTTHNLFEAKNCGDRILALKNGKIHQIIQTDKKEMLTQQELFAVCYE